MNMTELREAKHEISKWLDRRHYCQLRRDTFERKQRDYRAEQDTESLYYKYF